MVVILLLNLTVAVGTLNDLILYVNIIQANHQAFFVAWLNLYLGIETCLNLHWTEFLHILMATVHIIFCFYVLRFEFF